LSNGPPRARLVVEAGRRATRVEAGRTGAFEASNEGPIPYTTKLEPISRATKRAPYGALAPRSARRASLPTGAVHLSHLRCSRSCASASHLLTFPLAYYFNFRGDETFLNGMSGKGRGCLY